MLERKTLDRQALTEAARLSDATFREPGQTSMATAFPAMFDTNIFSTAPDKELQAILRRLVPVPLPSPSGFAYT